MVLNKKYKNGYGPSLIISIYTAVVSESVWLWFRLKLANGFVAQIICSLNTTGKMQSRKQGIYQHQAEQPIAKPEILIAVFEFYG